MAITFIFILLAVGILAFAVITQPFYEVSLEETQNQNGMSDSVLTASQSLYTNWLRDLEIDHMAGKISEQDYQTQKKQITARLVLAKENQVPQTLVNGDAGVPAVEALIQDRKSERVERSAGFCTQCGGPLQQSDLFCPSCGLKLK
jgi:hypothetical protein